MSFEALTFWSGNDYCSSLGSHLSYIKSSDEQADVGNYLDSILVTGKLIRGFFLHCVKISDLRGNINFLIYDIKSWKFKS